jgi:hypothetical protein
MGLPQRHLTVYDDIDLDKVIGTGMVHPAGIDGLDGVVEGHGLGGIETRSDFAYSGDVRMAMGVTLYTTSC